jgi:hypothetical protein
LETLAVVGLLCSSAAGSARAQTTISPTFVTEVDKLCSKIDADFAHALGPFPYPNFNREKPDHKTSVLVGKHFAKGLPVHRKIPAQLRKLGEPAAGAKAWDAIRSLALQDNAVGIRQVSDALAGNTKAFVATVHRLQDLHKQIVKEALAAGFRKSTPCGDAF